MLGGGHGAICAQFIEDAIRQCLQNRIGCVDRPFSSDCLVDYFAASIVCSSDSCPSTQAVSIVAIQMVGCGGVTRESGVTLSVSPVHVLIGVCIGSVGHSHRIGASLLGGGSVVAHRDLICGCLLQ